MTGPLHGLFDLTGQTAIVTGGSRGLGLQISEALGEFGAEIVITARKQAELDEAVAHLEGVGVRARAIAADMSQPEAVERVVADTLKASGKVDILVNNAGTTWGAPAADHPLDAWMKVINLNLTSVFLLSQAVARQSMIPRRSGRIINIASIEGLLGHHPTRGGTVAYNTSKGGVINMTRALAAEWGPHNITVNALAPGFFPSKMAKVVLEQHGQGLLDDTPLGKLGGEHDLKGPALLLASAAGGHITGQTLAVDGGFTII
jgi:NAD(P)-dependent dehydrogenase (short-subunit alcohol dehydrogenase family)